MSQRERMRQRAGAYPALGHSVAGEAAASPPSVQLRIDQLVLEGVAPGERYSVANAMQGELARLLAAQNAAAKIDAPVHQAQVDGGTIRITGSTRPAQFGAQIAQAVHGSLGLGTPTDGRNRRS